MKNFLKIWSKVPTNLQTTIISTVVCVALTATGANVETCQKIHDIFNAVAVESQ